MTRIRGVLSKVAKRAAVLSILWTGVVAAQATGPAADKPTPPKAEHIAHTRELHGRTLSDDYFWLRERKNPKVLEHLKAENAYTKAMTAHLKPLEDKLY